MAGWREVQGFDIAKILNYRGEYPVRDIQRAVILREFLFPKLPPTQDVSAKAVSAALKSQLGSPVRIGKQTMILKDWRNPSGRPRARFPTSCWRGMVPTHLEVGNMAYMANMEFFSLPEIQTRPFPENRVSRHVSRLKIPCIPCIPCGREP